MTVASSSSGSSRCTSSWVGASLRGIRMVGSSFSDAAGSVRRGIITVGSSRRGIRMVASSLCAGGGAGGVLRGISTVASSRRGSSTVASPSGAGRLAGGSACPRRDRSRMVRSSSSGAGARGTSASRSAATLCGRSAGRGFSIQSMACRKPAEQVASSAGWRASGGISSSTARAVAGGGARPISRKCSVAPSAYRSVQAPCLTAPASAYCSMGA